MAETKAALPEAPASVNFRFTFNGYDCQLTLRGHSGGEVLSKLDKATRWLSENGGAATQPTGNGTAPTCPTHDKLMKPSQYGGWYCPAKVADDDGTGKPVYCKQKAN